jgi:hypothetical protein
LRPVVAEGSNAETQHVEVDDNGGAHVHGAVNDQVDDHL